MGIDQQLDQLLGESQQPVAGFPPVTPKPKFVPESDDHQFFEDCSKADWFYHFSDDARVFKSAERDMKALKGRRTNDKRHGIFDAWYAHVFSGPNFGTPVVERPKWEDFA